MVIKQIKINNFRGIASLEIRPRAHVALVGEPRAGRTTVLEALRRTLTIEPSRKVITNTLDFHRKDTTKPIDIEVVLADLGAELEQTFFDYIEFWAPDRGEIVDTLQQEAGQAEPERVVRLGYRATWSEEQQIVLQFVHYPKAAEPENDLWERTRAQHLAELPIYVLDSAATPLAISARSEFRELVDDAAGGDFATGLEQFAAEVEGLGAQLAGTTQVTEALKSVTGDVEGTIGFGADDEPLGFTLEHGGVGGVLRALSPTLDIDAAGPLPVYRHGSRMETAIVAGQTLARVSAQKGIVLADDFGEQIDEAGALHIAALLRAKSSQCVLATRRAATLDAFATREIVRLVLQDDGAPANYYGEAPADKKERIAARHLSLQLYPAIASRALLITEGAHDHAALQAIARKLQGNVAIPQLASEGISLLHAAAADGAGGDHAIPRLASAAKRLGFRVVALIDGDVGKPEVLTAVEAATDAVIRFPDGVAIERALLSGISDPDIQLALCNLDATLPSGIEAKTGTDLTEAVIPLLKSSGGHHAQFVEALGDAVTPQLVQSALAKAIEAVRAGNNGLIQL